MFNRPYVQRLLFLGPIALFLAGCAELIHERHEFRSGWRDATIEQVADGDKLAAALRQSQCVAQFDPDDLSGTKFAVVNYWGVRIPKTRVIPVAQAAPWRAGDPVRINVLDCEAPLQARS